jgi:hypothetical protein
MNFAVELFLTSLGMIFFIVIVAEIICKIWRVQTYFGGDK